MKAIILITAIFYILGLKISHKIDVIERSGSVDKVIMVKPGSNTEKSKSISLHEDLNLVEPKDSVQKKGLEGDPFLRSR